jgi:hypothetical protein
VTWIRRGREAIMPQSQGEEARMRFDSAIA